MLCCCSYHVPVLLNSDQQDQSVQQNIQVCCFWGVPRKILSNFLTLESSRHSQYSRQQTCSSGAEGGGRENQASQAELAGVRFPFSASFPAS